MSETQNMSEILGLLDWYRAMGADAALDAAPVDWRARGPRAPGHDFAWPEKSNDTAPSAADRVPDHSERQSAQQAPSMPSAQRSATTPHPSRIEAQRTETRARPQTPLAPSEAETDARRSARTASSLEALGNALTAFDGCSLKATATNLCFYRGAATARLMIIGDAPGRDEDIAGKPFVGRAGVLLDKMLHAIGLGEQDVHLTNLVYWRPPGNRAPTPQEALACRPFLERQIELVKPEFILTLGGSAAKDMLGLADSIMRLRGKWREIQINNQALQAFATLHPDYLLRTPAAKQLAWHDLLEVKARLAR